MAVGPYALTSLANLKSFLGVSTSTDDAVMESCIDRATAQIEGWLGRAIVSRTVTEWFDGHLPRTLVLRQFPVTAVAGVFGGSQSAITVSSSDTTDIGATVSIVTDPVALIGQSTAATATSAAITTRTAATGTATTGTFLLSTYDDSSALADAIAAQDGFDATASGNYPSWMLHPRAAADCIDNTVTLTAATTNAAYALDAERGMLMLRGCDWIPCAVESHSPRATVVRYTAGYATVPADIEQVAIEAAKLLFQGRKADSRVGSESLGDYSYSVRTTSIVPLLAESLSQYRSIR